MATKPSSIRKDGLETHAEHEWSHHTGLRGKAKNGVSCKTECLLATLKMWPVSRNCPSQGSLRRQGHWTPCGVWDGILERKKDGREKLNLNKVESLLKDYVSIFAH